MAETTRFGLEKVGGSYGGSIADNGGKYTTTDRDTMDKLLAFFENHRHDGGTNPVALASPTAAATATISPTGGTISNGTTRYYKYSLIDQFGLESAASPELAVTLPALVTVTSAPIVTGATVGGSTLPSGVTYYYALTGVTTDGETELGPESVITVQAGQNQVNAILPALPTGITSWNLWRMAVTDQGWTKVGSTLAGGATFNDTGIATGDCLCDPTTQPPTTALAAAGASSITVTPGDLTGAVSWRLYESDTSGFYDSASLVAAIVPTVVGDPPPSSHVDTGAALLTGQPLLVSTTLTPSHAVAGGGGGGTGGGGADSHLITNLNDQTLPAASGDAVNVFFGGVMDVNGHDVLCILQPQVDTDGDELQINTDAVYGISVRVVAAGMTAGDVIMASVLFEDVEGTPASVGLSFAGQVVIPPGQTGVDSTITFPAIALQRATRFAIVLTPYYTGTFNEGSALSAAAGVFMASGSPAEAELYPAVTNLVVTDRGFGGELNVSFTPDSGSESYDVLAYQGISPVAKLSTTTSPVTITGLTNDTLAQIYVLGHKSIDGTPLYSTPASASGTPTFTAPSVGPLTDDFNRSNGDELVLPDYYSNLLSATAQFMCFGNQLINDDNTGSHAQGAVIHDFGADDKTITVTALPNFASAHLMTVIAAAVDHTLGNPRCTVSFDGTATAPTVDHYAADGTHTAIPMTSAGAWTTFNGTSATIRVDIHGTTVDLYQNGAIAWTATLPSAVTGAPYAGVALYPMFDNGGAIDDLDIAAYVAPGGGGGGGGGAPAVLPTDAYADAPSLVGLTGSVVVDTTAATSTDPKDAGINGSHSVWMKYTCTVGGPAQVDTIGTTDGHGSNCDTYLAVLRDDGGIVVGDDDGGGLLTSKCIWQALPGVSYHFRISDLNGTGTPDMHFNWNVPG